MTDENPDDPERGDDESDGYVDDILSRLRESVESTPNREDDSPAEQDVVDAEGLEADTDEGSDGGEEETEYDNDLSMFRPSSLSEEDSSDDDLDESELLTEVTPDDQPHLDSEEPAGSKDDQHAGPLAFLRGLIRLPSQFRSDGDQDVDDEIDEPTDIAAAAEPPGAFDPYATDDDAVDERRFSRFRGLLTSLVPSRRTRPDKPLRERLRELPSSVVDRLKLLVLGPSDTPGTRIGVLVSVLAAMVAAAGAFTLLGSGAETTSDSAWFISNFIGVLTSVWTYALIALVFTVALRLFWRRRAAQKAASETGFSVKTCMRLAAEARTADGTSTIIVSPSDSVDSASARILEAFETHKSALDYTGQHGLDDNIVEAAEDSAAAADETDLVIHDRANASPSEQARWSRLELASTLSFSDVFWSFGIPALVTFVGLLILVQFWVAWWVYALLAFASIMVGALWYVASHYRRRRHVKAVRQPDTKPSYSDIAVLVKKADMPEVTAYYGWVGGTVYADYNEIRLARTLSEVAHAHIEGETIPPTIQQKFARNLKQYLPNLEGYEDAEEKPEIMDRMVQEIAQTERGMLPKNRLADRIIRLDQQEVGGIGYDPRLVAECYDRLTPISLIEEDVRVKTTSDGEKDMTVVFLRTQPVSTEDAESEAQFSTDYQPDYEPDFRLPEVDMFVEGEQMV